MYAVRKKPYIIPITDDLFRIGERVKTIDPYLWLGLNRNLNRYEIHDSHPKVHPDHTMVMRIQTETGGFVHPTSLVLDELRKMMVLNSTKTGVLDELDRIAEARDREWKKRDADLMFALANDLNWAGKIVVPSVTWQRRSLAYQARRSNR